MSDLSPLQRYTALTKLDLASDGDVSVRDIKYVDSNHSGAVDGQEAATMFLKTEEEVKIVSAVMAKPEKYAGNPTQIMQGETGRLLKEFEKAENKPLPGDGIKYGNAGSVTPKAQKHLEEVAAALTATPDALRDGQVMQDLNTVRGILGDLINSPKASAAIKKWAAEAAAALDKIV